MYFNFILCCIQTCDSERLTHVYGFDPCVYILVVAFGQASKLGFLINTANDYSSFELILNQNHL